MLGSADNYIICDNDHKCSTPFIIFLENYMKKTNKLKCMHTVATTVHFFFNCEMVWHHVTGDVSKNIWGLLLKRSDVKHIIKNNKNLQWLLIFIAFLYNTFISTQVYINTPHI